MQARGAMLAALVAALVACQQAPAQLPPPLSLPTNLFGIDWTATEIGGVAVAPGVPSTLRVEPDQRAFGSGGCNRFSGRAVVEGPNIRLGPLASTRMACLGPRGEQEERYFVALDLARTYRLLEGRLYLLNAEGAALVVLTR
jgi:heat shock protein HslJ